MSELNMNTNDNTNKYNFELADKNYYQCEPGKYTTDIVIEENKQHKTDVWKAMNVCKSILNYHAKHHDDDKNIPENAEILCRALNEGDFTEWNKLHCEKQKHHYQYFLRPDCKDVTLFDIMECAADCVAASMRRSGKIRSWEEEYETFKHQGFDDFMAKVMANTFMMIQALLELD